MNPVFICILMGIIIASLFMIIIVWPPQQFVDFHDTMNNYIGTSNTIDEEIKRSFYPCIMRPFNDSTREIHQIYHIPPSTDRRIAFITISRLSNVEVNGTRLTDIVKSMDRKNVYLSFIEATTEETIIRVIGGDQKAHLQIAATPSYGGAYRR